MYRAVGVQTSCNGPDSRFWIDAVLPTTQEYTIRAYAAGSSQTGSYELDLESVVPPSPNARQTAYDTYLTDQINPAGDIEPVFHFTAGVGDVIDVTTDSQTINPCIYLFALDAHTTWNTCNGLQNQFEIRTNPVTVAGTYTILVYPAGPTTFWGVFGSTSMPERALCRRPYSRCLWISHAPGDTAGECGRGTLATGCTRSATHQDRP